MKKFVITLILLFIAVFGFAQTEQSNKTIAIARFKNASFNRGLDYLTTSVPEILTTYLSGIKGITIIERDRLEEVFKEKKLALMGFGDADEYSIIGEELSARAIMVGSFTTLGKYVRIDVRLIDVVKVKVLGTYQVTAEIGKDMENKISTLAQKVKFSLTGEPYAVINIYSEVEAQVVMDGQLIGTIPIEDRIVSVGKHSLTLGKSGYETKRVEFEVKNAETKSLRYNIPKLPKLFQISLGGGISTLQLGYESLLTSQYIGWETYLEIFYKKFSFNFSYGGKRVDYALPIHAPVDVLDTNSISLLNNEALLTLRYYPFTGNITPFVGLGAAIDTLYGDTNHNIATQTLATPVLELGSRVNFWNDRLSVFAVVQFQLPITYTLQEKYFSIFGGSTYSELEKKFEWFQLKLGLSYNIF